MVKIGVLIYSYNRVDDARISMEIIRNVWEKDYFGKVTIVHSYNGLKKWYPKKYLENDLVISKNSWHFRGAANLIDAGIKVFQRKYKSLDYVIVLASDTWLIKPKYLEVVLEKMQRKKLHLATCAWGLPKRGDIMDVGMAVDFFIVDMKWANRYKVFPIAYDRFYKRYNDLLLYQRGGNVMPEKLLLARYFGAVCREKGSGAIGKKEKIESILVLKEREPVHSRIDRDGNWIRKMYWPFMGLLTHHEPSPKKRILKAAGIRKGKYTGKLRQRKDLSYYNNGIAKMEHNSN